MSLRRGRKVLPMRQLIGFAFAAAAIGCAMIAFAHAGIGASKDRVANEARNLCCWVRPKIDLPAPAAYPILPSQALKPIY